MTGSSADGKRRFLVQHDYGMGALLWWIDARSAREILETFAEVEVVENAESIERALADSLEVVDVDAAEVVAGLSRRPSEQRDHPDFGKLAGRPVVHLRRPPAPEFGDRSVYFFEVESDGRRLRQVEIGEDGVAVKSTPDDWLFDPPVVDLFAPETAAWEIGRDEFEAAWRTAAPMPSDF
ncbi:hypothetical protein [Glycomyces harbinensis]|uniref:Uncharacterized protein n=1 Tax=Glycomyces harbinensis TaxID=58114 RepID=A0A1G7ADS6_9ACTN|nr:hypothetical protein [Glycomyces harbinensis]SDE13088.1 hypothetical protein SAMN05216270_11390 [Glycomyces harbinensis]